MLASCDPPEMRHGFETSVQAAYTPDEISECIGRSQLRDCAVVANPYGLVIHGRKQEHDA